MSDLERNRKSTYDLKIMGWILGFLGKYRGYFALSPSSDDGHRGT